MFLQELKNYNDIEQVISSYVPLKKRGRVFTCLLYTSFVFMESKSREGIYKPGSVADNDLSGPAVARRF